MKYFKPGEQNLGCRGSGTRWPLAPSVVVSKQKSVQLLSLSCDYKSQLNLMWTGLSHQSHARQMRARTGSDLMTLGYREIFGLQPRLSPAAGGVSVTGATLTLQHLGSHLSSSSFLVMALPSAAVLWFDWATEPVMVQPVQTLQQNKSVVERRP